MKTKIENFINLVKTFELKNATVALWYDGLIRLEAQNVKLVLLAHPEQSLIRRMKNVWEVKLETLALIAKGVKKDGKLLFFENPDSTNLTCIIGGASLLVSQVMYNDSVPSYNDKLRYEPANAQELVKTFDNIKQSADKESSYPLDCINIDINHWCALNGHQMQLERPSVTLPFGLYDANKLRAVLKAFKKCEDLKIAQTSELTVFNGDGLTVRFLRAENKGYPDVTYIIQRAEVATHKLTLDKQEFLSLLNFSVDYLKSSNSRVVFFRIANNSLSLVCEEHKIGDINFKGECSLEVVAFPANQLAGLVKVCDSDDVTLTFTDTKGPCQILGLTSYAVIMPMRI